MEKKKQRTPPSEWSEYNNSGRKPKNKDHRQPSPKRGFK